MENKIKPKKYPKHPETVKYERNEKRRLQVKTAYVIGKISKKMAIGQLCQYGWSINMAKNLIGNWMAENSLKEVG